MNKSSLAPTQQRIQEIIEALGFGVIERLAIRGGVPRYEPEPHIVQSIKLEPDPEHPPIRDNHDGPLKKEFESLFHLLSQVPDGVVDIEVRHGLPFRVLRHRHHAEFGVGRQG
jgi:hypothetical protein